MSIPYHHLLTLTNTTNPLPRFYVFFVCFLSLRSPLLLHSSSTPLPLFLHSSFTLGRSLTPALKFLLAAARANHIGCLNSQQDIVVFFANPLPLLSVDDEVGVARRDGDILGNVQHRGVDCKERTSRVRVFKSRVGRFAPSASSPSTR